VPQLPAPYNKGSHGLNHSSLPNNSLTNQPTPLHQLTPRLAAILHQSTTILTAVSRLSRNRSSSSLYSLGTDRKENASQRFFAASRSYSTDSVENIASQLLHCCLLRNCCLAAGVSAGFTVLALSKHATIYINNNLISSNIVTVFNCSSS
jgi:hypothetical protein